MIQQIKQIPVSSIILDEEIYPRKGIDHRRVGIFSENLRDGFAFDPIEVAPCPEIEPFTWDISSDQGLLWPVNAKGKLDLIIFDPPYFDKKAGVT